VEIEEFVLDVCVYNGYVPTTEERYLLQRSRTTVPSSHRDKFGSIELYDCPDLPFIYTLEVSKERPLRLIIRRRRRGDRADEPEECTEYGEDKAYDVRYPPLPFKTTVYWRIQELGGAYVKVHREHDC